MSTDLRKHARQTRTRMAVGLLAIILIAGDGLIYLLYGRNPALMGLVCIAAALLPVGVIWLIIALLDWTVKRVDRD